MTPERAAAEEEAAQQYAIAILSRFPTVSGYWRSLNTDIVARWSMTALRRIKRRAWQIAESGSSKPEVEKP